MNANKTTMMMISVDELKTDYTYQRPLLSEKTIERIKDNFSLQAFGAVTVAKRKSGVMYVVDGQQRVEAARRIDSKMKVPCVLFESDGKKEEAVAFFTLNTTRTRVRSVHKFIALTIAGREPETTINRWLQQKNMKVSGSATDTSMTIDFPAALVETWRNNEVSCKRAIDIQFRIANGQSMNSYIHTGLCYLIDHGVKVEDYETKIIQQGGKANMLCAIKRHALELGVERGARLNAIAILSIINHRCKTKVRMDVCE